MRCQLLVPDVDTPEGAFANLVLNAVEVFIGIGGAMEACIDRDGDGL